MSTAIADLIAKAKQDMNTPETTDVEVVVGDELVTLGFSKISGREFADHKAACPPRDGSKFDANLGFDADALAARLGPLVGYQVVDGEHVTIPAPLWGDLFGYAVNDEGVRTPKPSILSAEDIRTIGATLWGMHVLEEQKKAAALKKASLPREPKKRSSRAS